MSALTPLNSTLSSNVNNVQSQIKDVQTQLATGVKTLNSGELGTVTRLSSQVTGYQAAAANITQAQSAISVAQTGLASINDLVTQMIDLANKASNASLQDADRQKLQSTFDSLASQITKIASSSDLNGINVLKSAAADQTYQTGIASSDTMKVHAVASDAATLNIASAGATVTAGAMPAGTATSSAAGTLSIATASDASIAIGYLKSALDTVSVNQSSLSADSVGFAAKGKTDAAIATQLQNSIDSIQKPDQAKLQMDLQALNNQQSVDYYLISQLNTESSAAMTIFR